MHRSSIVISVLGSLCFVVVMTVFLYWILTVVAPSPTGWSNEVNWQSVNKLLEDGDDGNAGLAGEAGQQELVGDEMGSADEAGDQEIVGGGMESAGDQELVGGEVESTSGDEGGTGRSSEDDDGIVDGGSNRSDSGADNRVDAGVPGDSDSHHEAGRSEDVGGLDEVTDDGLIAVNTATSERLQELPGIGPAKAQAIIDYRDMYGKFNQVDELLGVKGIGEKTLEKLKPYIKLD